MGDFRHTKILATLGPASCDSDTIHALILAGANLFRLNFSHGSHDDHKNTYQIIRTLSKRLDTPIGVVADLQGAKLRLGTFENKSITIKAGRRLRLDSDPAAGNDQRVYLPHPEIIQTLDIGDSLFFDDGKVRAAVREKGDDYLDIEILSGSALSDKKGVNIPDRILPLPPLTDKDKADLAFALDLGVDWIAQSFVQSAADVQEALSLIDGRAALMAKIEKPSALRNIDDILSLCDGLMIARGDLGVEIPPEHVPTYQKKLIRKSREAGKPVVVATQMLESMIESARPTRAEASDVATAVYDGADAVMLSAETAAGAHPIRAVEMMHRICLSCESDEWYEDVVNAHMPQSAHTEADAITQAAYIVAADIDARFIVTYTLSGSTALRMARMRPDIPILCLTPNANVAQKLSVSFGIKAVIAPETIDQDFTGPARYAAKIAQDIGFGAPDDSFVMTAGVPFAMPGSTNLLRIAKI